MGFFVPGEQEQAEQQQQQEQFQEQPQYEEQPQEQYYQQYEPQQQTFTEQRQPEVTYENGIPVLIDGRELTPLERIDLMDGVLDGMYFGAPILGLQKGICPRAAVTAQPLVRPMVQSVTRYAPAPAVAYAPPVPAPVSIPQPPPQYAYQPIAAPQPMAYPQPVYAQPQPSYYPRQATVKVAVRSPFVRGTPTWF